MHKIHHMNHSESRQLKQHMTIRRIPKVAYSNCSSIFTPVRCKQTTEGRNQCQATCVLDPVTPVTPVTLPSKGFPGPQVPTALNPSNPSNPSSTLLAKISTSCTPANFDACSSTPDHRKRQPRLCSFFFSRTSWTVEPTFSSPSPGIHGVSSSPPWLEPETSPNWVLATRMAHQNMASPKMCLVSFTCFTTISTLSLWAFEEDMIPMLSRSHCTTRPAQATLPSKA